MKKLSKLMTAIGLLAALALPAMAQSAKMPVNVDDSDMAIQGYDPVAFFTDNKPVKIDVDAFQIVDGKLLLQYNMSIRDKFNKDARGNLAKADANWPSLVKKSGK